MAYKFLKNTSSALDSKHTHSVVVGSLARDPRDINRVVPMVSFQNYSQSVKSVHSENSGVYNSTAVVGLDQLFRPYSIDQNNGNLYPYTTISGNTIFLGSGLPYMSKYSLPNSLVTYSGSTSITSLSLHPFPYEPSNNIGGHDAQWFTSGSSYSGLHVHKKQDDSFTSARSIALKGPIQITSWGYNIAGNPVPHASGNVKFQIQTGSLYTYSSGSYPSGIVSGYNVISSGNVFAPHAFEDSTKWLTGPLDVRFNPIRGVWSAASCLKGKFTEIVPANTGIGDFSIYINNQDSGWKVRAMNWAPSAIPANVKCVLGWDEMESYWLVTNVLEC